MGMVAFGTEALAKMIKKGVKYNKEGFDETDSRLGRRYITLPGSTMADVSKICKANGITDDDRIAAIFNECSPIKKSEGGRMVTVVEDHRRIKRIVLRELLKQQNN
jgi:predicted metal-dependent peptidase